MHIWSDFHTACRNRKERSSGWPQKSHLNTLNRNELIFIPPMFSGELQSEEVPYICFPYICFNIEGLDLYFQVLLIYLFSTKGCFRLKWSKNKSESILNADPHFLNEKKKILKSIANVLYEMDRNRNENVQNNALYKRSGTYSTCPGCNCQFCMDEYAEKKSLKNTSL